jgi:hypothetical protein
MASSFAPGEYLEAARETYMDEKKQELKDRYNFSAYVLQNDYYQLLKSCVENAAMTLNGE